MLPPTESRVKPDQALRWIVGLAIGIRARYQGKPFPIQDALESFIGRFQILPYPKLGLTQQNAARVKIDGLRGILPQSFPCYSVWTATKTTRNHVFDNEISISIPRSMPRSSMVQNKTLNINPLKKYHPVPKWELIMRNHYQIGPKIEKILGRAGGRGRARVEIINSLQKFSNFRSPRRF